MSTTSADYALQNVKGIKKSFDNAVQNKLNEYINQRYIKFYQTSEISEIFTSTESLSGAREVAAEETPPTVVLNDGYSVTISEKRFASAIVLPENVYRRDGRDNTVKVESYLMRQRNQALIDNTNLLLTNAHLMLNEAFDSTSVYLAPDGVEVAGSHTWNSGGTFDNGITNSFESAEVDTAWDYAGRFTDGSGKPMPLSWTDIVVKKGSAAEREAIRLFAKEIKPTAVNDINIYEGTMKITSTPYITYANTLNWFMYDLSMYESPLAVGVGEYPTMRDPIKLDNEAIRSNITGFWKQGVINMPFNMYASTGAT